MTHKTPDQHKRNDKEIERDGIYEPRARRRKKINQGKIKRKKQQMVVHEEARKKTGRGKGGRKGNEDGTGGSRRGGNA